MDGNADHDRIKVGRDDGRFRALQIRVERAPIEFQRVVVHYGNGADEQLDIRQRISPGWSTRVIDLRGDNRVIESVEIWYARGSWDSRKPKLRLYGRFSSSLKPEVGAGLVPAPTQFAAPALRT